MDLHKSGRIGMPGLGTVFLAFLAFSACGRGDISLPERMPDPGSCAEETFLEAIPHTWGMVRQILVDVHIPDTEFTREKWEPQTIWSYYLVHWEEQEDGSIKQTEQICEMALTEVPVAPMTVQDTVISQAIIDSAPPANWIASVDLTDAGDGSGECAVEYRLDRPEGGPQFWVMGARLDEPDLQTCPVTPDGLGDPSNPAQYDQDRDGHPGVTVEQLINGEHHSDLYMCSRTLYQFAPGAVSRIDGQGYRIQGMVHGVSVDQSLYGASEPEMEENDPETNWNPNEYTYYILTELPDDATCRDVSHDLFFNQ